MDHVEYLYGVARSVAAHSDARSGRLVGRAHRMPLLELLALTAMIVGGVYAALWTHTRNR